MAEQDSLKNRFEKIKAENRSFLNKLALCKEESMALKKLLADNNNLFNSIPTGLILLQQGIVIDINQTALDQLGYQAHEIIGSDFLDLVPPLLKPMVKKRHNRRLSPKAVPDQFESELLAKNGRPVDFDCSFSKLKMNGRMALLFSMSLQAERKQKERDAIQSEKKEAILTMASGMTHYFIPALKEITDNAKRMMEMKDSGNETLTKSLENIDHAVQRINIMHNKLARLSGVQPSESKRSLFDLRDVVKMVVAETRPKLEELERSRGTKIDVKTYLRPVSPIMGDIEEIKAAMINVISNAVEAMPEGGSLYITTEENAGRSFTYFQDNGIGIDEPIKGRMVDPFFTTKGDGNVGLGLSVADAIIGRHGGTIEIAGENESGSTITIMLPVSSQEPEPRAAASKRHVKNAKILLIEQDDLIRELLSQVLSAKGYRVMTVDNPIEGLKKIKKQNFELLIADFKIPGKRDASMLEKIKEMNPSLPIALILEHDDAVKEPLRALSHFELIFKKPLDINRLVNQIPEIVMRHRSSR